MAEYLPATIESVLGNLGPDDQYFVIDGGSTDGSIEVLKHYADRLTGWVSEKDKGYADAVAKGFARGLSKYQSWIACGDLLLPGALDVARVVLDESSADMIYGDDFYIDDDDHILQLSSGAVPDMAAMMLYGDWTPLQDACFWRSDFYHSVGGLNPELRYAADYDLFLRMSLSGHCLYIPHVFSAFRRHSGQTSIQYHDAYVKERSGAKRQALVSRHMPIRESVLRPYWWVYSRMRARLGYKKGIQSCYYGSSVDGYISAPTKIFSGYGW